MELITKGEIFEQWKGAPDGSSAYLEGSLTIRITLRDMCHEEIESLSTGQFKTSILEKNSIPFIIINFGNSFSFDCAINICEVGDTTYEKGEGCALTMIGIETATGEVKTLRTCGLGTDFSIKLKEMAKKYDGFNALTKASEIMKIQRTIETIDLEKEAEISYISGTV